MDQEISPRRRKKDEASTKLIRRTFAILLKMDGMLIRFLNIIEKDPSSLVKDNIIYEKWRKASKIKDWLEEKKSEFDISKIDEGIKKISDQLFDKVEFLRKFHYSQYKEPTKPVTVKGLSSFTSLTLLKAFEFNPKNRTVENMNVIKTIKNRQAKEKTLDDSVITLLKDDVTAAEIQKFSEKYYSRGFTIAWALCTFNKIFAGLTSNKTKCCIIDYINQFFKRGTPDFWHYTRKTYACGTDFQEMLRTFFFGIVGQTLDYCITTKSDKELCILLESLKWNYSASDFNPLKRSYILERLSPKYECYLTSLWKYEETGMSSDNIKKKVQLMLISTYDFIVMRVILRACQEGEKAVEVESTRKQIKLERYSSTIDDNVANSILKELLNVIFQEIDKKVQYNKTKPKDKKDPLGIISYSLLSIVTKICNFINNSLEQQARMKDVFQEPWIIILIDSLEYMDIESQYLALKCLQILLKLVPSKIMAASKTFLNEKKEKYAALACEIENPFACIVIFYTISMVSMTKTQDFHSTAFNEALSLINQFIKEDPSINGVASGIKPALLKWIIQTVEKVTLEQIKDIKIQTIDCVISIMGGVFKGLKPRTKGYYTKTGQNAEIVDSQCVPGKLYIYLEKDKNETQTKAWQSITKIKKTKFIPKDDKIDVISELKLEEGLNILGCLEKIVLFDDCPAMRKAKIGKIFSIILDQREDIAKEYLAKGKLYTLLKLASVSPKIKYCKSKNMVELLINYLPEVVEEVAQPIKKITLLKKENDQILISDEKETFKFDCQFDINLKEGSFEIVNYDPEHTNEKSKTQIAFLSQKPDKIMPELYAGIICTRDSAMVEFPPDAMLILIRDRENIFAGLMGNGQAGPQAILEEERGPSYDDSDMFSLERNQRDDDVSKKRKEAVKKCIENSKEDCKRKLKEVLQDSLGFSARHAILSVLCHNKEKLKNIPKDFLVQIFECLQMLFVEADYLEKGFMTNKMMSLIVELADNIALHPDFNSQFFLFVDKISTAITKEKLSSYKLFNLDSAEPIKFYFQFILSFFKRLLQNSGAQFISCKEFPSIMVLIDSIRSNPRGEILNVYHAFGMLIDILRCCEQNLNSPNTPEYLSRILTSSIIKYCGDYTDRSTESRLYTQIHAVKALSDTLLGRALKMFKNATIKGEFSRHTRMEQKVLSLTSLPDFTTAYKLYYQKKNRYQQSNSTKEIEIKPFCLTGYNIPIEPRKECTYEIERNGKSSILI